MEHGQDERICLSVIPAVCWAQKAAASGWGEARSEQEHTGDAWASSADEGRGTLRKALVSRVQA
jgi:hypothetical protein